MKPQDLLKEHPLTTIEGEGAYSELSMRTIGDLLYSLATPADATRSAFIRRFLQELEPWIPVAQKNGGKMAKRISAYMHKQYKHTLSDRVLAGLGGFLTDDLPVGAQHYDVTNQFNWRGGEFGDDGSCFMSSRPQTLRAMKDNGGHALRLWESNPGRGMGRAWVMPTPLEFPVLFNAYGPSIDSFRSRLRVLLPDEPTVYVKLVNMDRADGSLYINGGVGLLIGTEGREFQDKVDLGVGFGDDRMVLCDDCGGRVRYRDTLNAFLTDNHREASRICRTCADTKYVSCELSGYLHPEALTQLVEAVYGNDRHPETRLRYGRIQMVRVATYYLLERGINTCPKCNRPMINSGSYYINDNGNKTHACYQCAHEFTMACGSCSTYLRPEQKCSCGSTRKPARRTE